MLFVGEGKYIYRDGGHYYGEYRNLRTQISDTSENPIPLPLCDGKRHGTGVRVWSTGTRYEGQWVEDKMQGTGVLITAEGGKYEGSFFNGLRSGRGMEEIGNNVGITYICPLGNKHFGAGHCTYNGSYLQGLFHGYGEFQCISGPAYKGEWKRGKKDGQGEMIFLRDSESGDPDRQWMGRNGSLYRLKKYKGEYKDDVRQGNGIATYTNGDSLEGHFENNQPHGIIVCTFARSGRVRLSRYNRGIREEWIEIKHKSAPGTAKGTARIKDTAHSSKTSRKSHRKLTANS